VKDDRVYLEHILECIGRIEEDTRCGRDLFLGNRTLQDAVLRNLHTLTESTQRLSESLKALHSEVEWKRISAFRNVVVHNYLGIDMLRVWDNVANDLPVLKRHVQAILRELDAEAGQTES
jgi:uncharacterized protein with HEPN domain